MIDLRAVLADYLALRRSLGYKLERSGRLLAEFVSYLQQSGANRVSIELVLGWATLAEGRSRWPAQRLGMVRGFARYLQALDPDTEVPPRGLLPGGEHRPSPYLYSAAEVTALMAAAGRLRSPVRAATLETLIGLLAVTGLRVAEVIRLDRADVDFDRRLLMVRNSKLGKSRMVPLHPSTVEELRTYLARRDQLLPDPSSPSLFISTTGTRLRAGNLRTVFGALLDCAGVRSHPQRRPRLGDFRHSTAVATLLGWYEQGQDVQAQLPLLSTYLGHVNPRSTYWYLQAAPELLAAAAQRLQDRSGGPR
jgi:integrase/recombinase XerD